MRIVGGGGTTTVGRLKRRSKMMIIHNSDSVGGVVFRRILTLILFFAFVGVPSLYLYSAVYHPFQSSNNLLTGSAFSYNINHPEDSEEVRLERILKEAAIGERTVILTTLNEAWAAPGSIIDLFLESFRIGDNTSKLLNHLVIIALDQKAYSRCLAVHSHCFPLSTEGVDFSKEAYFMTPDYLKMMWRRIAFLLSVLEMGYDFVFTVISLLDADFQIACDLFFGSSYDLQNRPNGGFNYVKSNNRTIEFYKFWYSSREIHPGYHDQDVLNMIKFDPFIMEIGLKMRFLNTAYFGGFCEPSKDLNQVCTMHANCCLGLDNKVHDLKIMLEDWRRFLSLPPTMKRTTQSGWRVPQNCSLASFHTNNLPMENVEEGEIGDTQN
ncbi:uncharacterized protein At4g15970-like isoform X2 [Papaver somniferum]|uniref:uncharacterized protein At4g15970-like isoform X2 n=1 Tax=Papaver somniferum TaxID=3469 RepID=UPI000E6F96EF|nr:uncharacterized protein At4g15970-like isoform X2 [Papaver somniferum]